ncbi:MAG: DNA-3-methyladenine glycosylase 2 family protein [Clostridiales bacterium]|jgi:DNA-3-methyladenine glycosylase II|nr:DNA-3-methyladenine glycosylase 2 family protein [Clostridiales bacterium]
MRATHITATEEARTYLTQADPVLGAVIARYAPISYGLAANDFEALVSNIIGQQLSGRVADVIWGRVETLLGGIVTPETILQADPEAMRAAGMSYQKVAYTKNLADAAARRQITFDRFDGLPDAEIIAQLTAVKGIGKWTAEMFLIFSLGRADVFSLGDGGLAAAMDALYGDGERLPPKAREKIAARWAPYRSIASLYLWKSLENRTE